MVVASKIKISFMISYVRLRCRRKGKKNEKGREGGRTLIYGAIRTVHATGGKKTLVEGFTDK